MNTNRIKQLFAAFAQKFPVPGKDAPKENEPRARPQMIKGPLLARGNLVLRDEAALEYLEMLDKASEIAASDGIWSRTSLDDLLAESVFHVATAPPEARAESIRIQADRIVGLLKNAPDKWNVDMSVAGLSPDCAGQTFGRIQFLLDSVKSRLESPELDDDAGKRKVLFIRACVESIDVQSARPAAQALADQHLAVLNALFSDWQPSRIDLYRGQPKPIIRESIMRAVKIGGNTGQTEFGNTLTGTILSRDEWIRFLRARGGIDVSGLLIRDDTFATRIIAGYVTAGTACVEPKPQLAFLLFAIALESIVLGRQKTEITYQLSSRVAHLLAHTLDARRSIVTQVNDFYRLRSAIVHSGERDISESDVYAIRRVCLTGLQTLATSPDFARMNSTEELDQWFEDRMLAGA